MKLDQKFYGEIQKVKDDSVVPNDEWMVFLAKDSAFALYALPAYRHACVYLGCDAEQVAAVDRAMEKVLTWRAAHPDRLKIPDAAGEKLLP